MAMSATSSTDKLVRMANQIATFFRSYPEEEAVAGIRKHIAAYWTPTMRARLEAHAAQAGGRLDPLVVAAFERAAAPSPVRPATSDPHRLGEGASDAG
jgi:formate dehydrogenase subunit delta